MNSKIRISSKAALVRPRQFLAALMAMMYLCATSLAQSAGDFDPSFDMSVGANGTVNVIFPLPDGRVLVGGEYTSIQGSPIMFLARLNADGSLDNTFDTGTGLSSSVTRILPYGQDQLLIVGNFTVINGEVRNRIAVLNSDGSLDMNFPDVLGMTVQRIEAVAVQQDGKIVVGGDITAPHNGIARINADGSLDNSFNPGTGIWAPSEPKILDLIIRPDGGIVAVGIFSEFDGNNVGGVVQLQADGSFNPFANNSGTGADGAIFDVEPMPEGQMLLSGIFSSYDGNTSTGTVLVATDLGFTLPAVVGIGFSGGLSLVRRAHYTPDGKIILVGNFTQYAMTQANAIIRLNSDLTVDLSFNSGQGSNDIFFVASSWDGRLLLGGTLTLYDGNPTGRLARIFGDSCFSRLTGTVTLDEQPVTAGKVYIYTEQLAGAGYAIADSTEITDGEYFFPSLAEFPVTYILQAVPDPQTYPPNLAVPTFFSPDGPSHEWNDPALTYSLNSTCGNIDTINITVLQPESSTVGPGTGTISGQLRWAENKVAAEDPIPIIDIVVERVPPGNSVFAYTQTDAQGNYTFTGLPLTAGEDFVYGIHVSIPGIPMQNTYLISITEEGQTFSDLDFLADTIQNIIYPVGNINVGIQQVEKRKLTAYPSPMREYMHVVVSQDFQGRLTAEISDLKGSIISSIGGLQAPVFRLDGSGLSAGTYVLRVSDVHGKWESLQFMVGY